MKKFLLPLFAGLLSSFAVASDLEDLAREGYGVIEQTSVDGDFNGCEWGRRIPLRGQLIFECATYSYSYGYSPEVLILKSVRSGNIKVLIDGNEYSGTIYRRK